jgi:hypothetical protein
MRVPERGEAMDLRQRVELTLLMEADDAATIIEWQRRGTHFREIEVRPPWSARTWVEAHYEEVEWCGSIRASALIGALVDDF